ncbi:MAG: hypothetical protein ABJG47_17995 [Ekhidna sp.]
MSGEYDLNVVNKHLNYDKVSLIKPSNSSYIHIVAEIDIQPTPLFLTTSSKKKKLIEHCKNWCKVLEQINGVIEISLFKATLIPPGMGKYVKENSDDIHLAKFDFVILIEIVNENIIAEIKHHQVYEVMVNEIEQVASYSQVMLASNIKRMGKVNHKKQGVFLFNYFSAQSRQQNLKVWEYTAGWFEKETGLDNSTLLFPLNEKDTHYSVVNHCRWDGYLDILPSLVFKRSFKKYVLDNFYSNNVGAQPILYQVI